MAKRILPTLILSAAIAAASPAATLTLSGGALGGAAGATVGWGFTITSTPIEDAGNPITPWLLITFADFVPDAGSNPVGVFTPFITQLPDANVVIGPDAGNGEINPWSQAFDPNALTGIGSYAINSFQMPGDQVTGNIVLYYDEYSVSPDSASFDPQNDIIAVGQTMSAPASVTVTVTPEPAETWLLAAALCLLFARRGTWISICFSSASASLDTPPRKKPLTWC